jgi:hypothetical protein
VQHVCVINSVGATWKYSDINDEIFKVESLIRQTPYIFFYNYHSTSGSADYINAIKNHNDEYVYSINITKGSSINLPIFSSL